MKTAKLKFNHNLKKSDRNRIIKRYLEESSPDLRKWLLQKNRTIPTIDYAKMELKITSLMASTVETMVRHHDL